MADQDMFDMKKPCPICGRLMEMDPDGGWCAFDEIYFGADELSDYADDDDADDDDDDPSTWPPITHEDIGETYPRF